MAEAEAEPTGDPPAGLPAGTTRGPAANALTLCGLPDEVLVRVIRRLSDDYDDRLSAALACRKLRDAVLRDALARAQQARSSANSDILACEEQLAFHASDHSEYRSDFGHAGAQYNLGQCYAEGRGVPQDIREAARWLRCAADQNHAAAQLALGRLYVEGRGRAVPRHPQDGTRLIAQAARQVEDEAIRQEALDELKSLANERDIVKVCCIGCGASRGLKVCTKCHVAKFCGAECARRMWPAHKKSCKLWAAQVAREAPSPTAAEAAPPASLLAAAAEAASPTAVPAAAAEDEAAPLEATAERARAEPMPDPQKPTPDPE